MPRYKAARSAGLAAGGSDRGAFESLRETLQASAALSRRGSWDIHQSDIDRMDLEPAAADALRKAFAELKLEWIRGNWPSDGKVTFVTWLADIPARATRPPASCGRRPARPASRGAPTAPASTSTHRSTATGTGSPS